MCVCVCVCWGGGVDIWFEVEFHFDMLTEILVGNLRGDVGKALRWMGSGSQEIPADPVYWRCNFESLPPHSDASTVGVGLPTTSFGYAAFFCPKGSPPSQ